MIQRDSEERGVCVCVTLSDETASLKSSDSTTSAEQYQEEMDIISFVLKAD